MLVQQLMRHVAQDSADTLSACGYDDTPFLMYCASLERTLARQGFHVLDVVSQRYKSLMMSACSNGYLPPLGHGWMITEGNPFPNVISPYDEVLDKGQASRSLNGYLGKSSLLDDPITDFKAIVAILNWHSLWGKLTFAGESQGVADYAGFIARSQNCERFAGCTWEDIIPLTTRDRNQLRELTRSRRLGRAKHGPGATADQLIGWDKWLALDKPTRPVIRMTDVPKDRLKRRLIGIEHTKMQWIQQALASELRSSRWFRNWINLEDQQAHVKFACGAHARCTIDLSDASDRIPLSLVEYLLPEWYPTLATASSAYAELKNGETVPLGMAATMGNGFCFELETLIFHIVASLAGRIYDINGGFAPQRLAHYAQQCRVYGDDIITPQAWLPAFEQLCAQLGWVISWHKTGRVNFLETCGAYIDAQTSEFRRRLVPYLETTDRTGTSFKLQWESDVELLACAANFTRAGCPKTARALARPVIKTARFRWNSSLQRTEMLLSTESAITRPLSVTEETRLLAYWICGLTQQLDEPTGAFRIRRTWVPYRDWAHIWTESTRPNTDWEPFPNSPVSVRFADLTTA